MSRQIFAGYDIGNWRPKIAYKVGKVEGTAMMRSAIDIVDQEVDGAFYCSESRSDWAGKAWIPDVMGEHHVMFSPNGKADYCLPLLISTLWEVLKNNDRLIVVACVPRKDVLGVAVEQSLNGTHTVSCNGVTKTLTIEVLETAHEGAGCIYYETQVAGLKAQRFMLTEIGGSTINRSIFHRMKLACEPYVLETLGGRWLVTEVAKSRQGCQAAGNSEGLSLEAATTIVETPGHVLQLKNGRFNFSDTVAIEVKRWLEKSITAMEMKTQHHDREVDIKLASGGSCLVPAVRKYLEDRGYVIVSEPLWGNAKGLLLRVEALMKKANAA